MGYTTEFTGEFLIDKPVTKEFREYINKFSSTRRMERNPQVIMRIYPNWKDMCFHGNLGKYGEFFVKDDGNFGQFRDSSIINYNSSAPTQPGLWCQWVCSLLNEDDNKDDDAHPCKVCWDGGEKFYDYVEWLEYMIKNFFAPDGYMLNGMVLAVGEGHGDAQYIVVENNHVFTYDAMDEYSYDLIAKIHSGTEEIMSEFDSVYKNPDEITSQYWDDDDEDYENEDY